MLKLSDMTDEELDELRSSLEADLSAIAKEGFPEAVGLSAELDRVETEILYRFAVATGQL